MTATGERQDYSAQVGLMRWNRVFSPLFREDASPDSLTLIPWQNGKCVTWEVTVCYSLTLSYLHIVISVLQSSSPHYLRDIITMPSRSTRSSSLVTLLHRQAQSSLKITNRSFRFAAPHLWNKLPPSLRVPCPPATSEYSPPLPGSDSAPKSVVGVSHRVFHSRLKTHLFSRSFPP